MSAFSVTSEPNLKPVRATENAAEDTAAQFLKKTHENKQKNPHAAPNCKTSMPIQSETSLCMGIYTGHFNFLNRAVGKSYNIVASGRSSVLGGRDGARSCAVSAFFFRILSQIKSPFLF